MTGDIGRDYFNRSGSDDVNFMLAGDIILFEASAVSDSLVSKFQSTIGYPNPACRIVHSAIYLGHGALCHAIAGAGFGRPFGGLVIQRTWDSIQVDDRMIYVLRDRKLTRQQRTEIALYSATKCLHNSAYDWKKIVEILIRFVDSVPSTKKAARVFGKDMYRDLGRWFLLGKDYDLSHTGEMNKGLIKDPREFFGDGLEQQIESRDEIGLLKRGGLTSFICSDFVTHCYNFVLNEKSPFVSLVATKTPLYVPADIYLATHLECVVTSAQADIIKKNKELIKHATSR